MSFFNAQEGKNELVNQTIIGLDLILNTLHFLWEVSQCINCVSNKILISDLFSANPYLLMQYQNYLIIFDLSD